VGTKPQPNAIAFVLALRCTVVSYTESAILGLGEYTDETPRVHIAARRRGPLHVGHDERTDRAMITTTPEAYMAIVVLTRLYLLTLEHVAGRDVEPARNRLHQLIAGDREAIHLAAAG
jgi:hypothetical protein